jgi:hypothetical protein
VFSSSVFTGVNDLVIATIVSTGQERQVMEQASRSSDKDKIYIRFHDWLLSSAFGMGHGCSIRDNCTFFAIFLW